MTGSSEASAIEAVGKAEAEGMRQKAAAYKMYGDAALTALVLEALPKVTTILLFVINIPVLLWVTGTSLLHEACEVTH